MKTQKSFKLSFLFSYITTRLPANAQQEAKRRNKPQLKTTKYKYYL